MELYSFNDEYLSRLRAREPAIEEHFVSYFSDRLRITLRARGIDTHMIDDVRQETFCRVWMAVRAGTIMNPEGFGAYVHSVCKNVLLESRRNEKRNEHESLQSRDIADEKCGLEELMQRQENEQLIRDALSRLSQKEHQLLLAYYSHDAHALKEREQLAKKESLPLSHLRVLVQRLRQKISKDLLARLELAREKDKAYELP